MLDDASIRSGAGPNAKNYQSWTITKKGLGISFDAYQVGPYAAGRSLGSSLIPRSRMSSSLTGRLARLLSESGDGDAETRRHGDAETRRHGDTETRRHGDAETRRYGNSALDNHGRRARRGLGKGDESKLGTRTPWNSRLETFP